MQQALGLKDRKGMLGTNHVCFKHALKIEKKFPGFIESVLQNAQACLKHTASCTVFLFHMLIFP